MTSRQKDGDLFRAAMSDVEPIDNEDQLRPRPVLRKPVPLSEREREALMELDRIASGEGPFDAVDSEDVIEGVVRGVDPRVLTSLRRGEFTIQADLDLHGTVAADARVLVERFLVDAHARGLRCLRVVHGRGRNSPGGVPVLKQSLPRWLARGPARRLVLAYATAQPKDGGVGATCVLLRKG